MYISSLKDIPKSRHYVIVTVQSVFIPGDERSREAPGHGYGARTEHYPSIQVFENEQDWLKEIQELTERKTEFSAYLAVPAEIETKTTVNVSFKGKLE